MKRILLGLLLAVSFASAQLELNVESTVVRKNVPLRIFVNSDKSATLHIYNRFGNLVYSAKVMGREVHTYSFRKHGIYIIVLRDEVSNTLKKIILVVPN